MKHARSIVAILLITIFTLTLLPLPALAEAIQPYESVEHLEEDVSIYHNKDGSETLVVEAVPSEGSANMKSDRLQDTGTALVGTGGDAQVQKISKSMMWKRL